MTPRGLALAGWQSASSSAPSSPLPRPLPPRPAPFSSCRSPHSDLGREEQWIGEGVAQSLAAGPGARSPRSCRSTGAGSGGIAQAEAWDEAAALSAARRLGADLAVFGEVRRTGGELSMQPRFVEISGATALERGTLDPVPVAEGKLMERLRPLPVAYLRALKMTA